MAIKFKYFMKLIIPMMLICLLTTPVYASAPANDNFADRILISGESGSTTASNVDATMELNEPFSWYYYGDLNSSVWWTWQAPSTGTYAFDVSGDYENAILIYTGSAVNELVAVAGNAYVDWNDETTSRVVFKAIEGVFYQIAICGLYSDQGTVALEWSIVTPPDHDDYLYARAISSFSGTDTSSNWNATFEPNEIESLYVNAAVGIAANSVWWKWTAPETGIFTFDTIGSGLVDTILDVYTGSSLSLLTSIAHNDDILPSAWSSVWFNATMGTDYYICVTGYFGCKGLITLNWNQNQEPYITSDGSTAFEVGAPGSFIVTATGVPASTVTLTAWTLPSGVAYDSSTKTLSGTPAAGTGGVYNLVFTASNGIGANAIQNFVLTVNEAPYFTSGGSTTFYIGMPASFPITAGGYPVPSVTLTAGTPPSGITYDSIDEQLIGTADGTAGSYPLEFTASNGIGVDAIQSFALTVTLCAPRIMAQPVNQAATVGEPAVFTVTAIGSPVLTFQWQLCINARKNIWSDIPGANSYSYTTPGSNLKMDGYLYRVVIVNSAGSVTSDQAGLAVYGAPISSADVSVDVSTGIYNDVDKTITWTVMVNNLGPDPAEGVQVVNTLAKFTRFLSVDISSISGATYKVQGSKVIVDIGQVTDPCTFTITTMINRAASPTTHTANVATASFDPDLANNSDTYALIWP